MVAADRLWLRPRSARQSYPNTEGLCTDQRGYPLSLPYRTTKLPTMRISTWARTALGGKLFIHARQDPYSQDMIEHSHQGRVLGFFGVDNKIKQQRRPKLSSSLANLPSFDRRVLTLTTLYLVCVFFDKDSSIFVMTCYYTHFGNWF